MAKCVKCQRRKAKRFCIALGQSICSLCCGQLREKEIHCPPGCRFLLQHKPYQEDRVIERRLRQAGRRELPEDDILRDERMAWLVFQAEVAIKVYSDNHQAIRDKDVLIALEYAKDKQAKGTGTLIVPDKKLGSLNDLGEEIFRRIEDCRFEKRVILPGVQAGYSPQEKIKGLDRLILSVQHWAEGNVDGRVYLDKLSDRLSRLQNNSGQKKIITLS